MSAGLEFEDLIARFFSESKFQVTKSVPIPSGEVDMVVTSPKGVQTVVEAKFFRSRYASNENLFNIVRRLESSRRATSCRWALLVTTARVAEVVHRRISVFPAVVVYDYDRVKRLLASFPDLADHFSELIRNAHAFGTGSDDEERQGSSEDKTPHELLGEAGCNTDTIAARVDPELPTRGEELHRQLTELHAEQQGASAEKLRKNLAKRFEVLCYESFRYLFADDLTAWSPQKYTAKRLNRYDFVARVYSRSDFWNLLVADFASRYVVFESKFYRKPIGQGQVLSTEKYLYRTALRSTAIVVASNGVNKSGKETARGALREHGKLIVILSTADLCAMLLSKDGSIGPDRVPADVENVLFNALDGLLMQIDR